MIDLDNEFRSGDVDNILLRKILGRLRALLQAILNIPQIVVDSDQITIGKVTLAADGGTPVANVTTATPGASDGGLVVRNIPSGTQAVSGTVSVGNFPATQPVSGSVSVGNFPATQPVSGSVSVSNFPASQPVTIPGGEADPFYAASRTGLIGAKTAKVFHVMGRRAGFNSTSILQDVAEFLATSTDALPELTGAENLEVVSSSTSDTLAGTGAQKVRVTYLDTSNNMVTSADISMNGTTPVALAFKANFIYSMQVSQVGTNTVSVGTILLRIAGAGATQEQITAGGNRSLSCRFAVPTGYTAYISAWQGASIGNATQDLRLRATVREDRSLGTVYIFQDNAFLVAGASLAEDLPWLACPALSRIKVSTLSSATAGTNRVDSDFSILLIQN